MENQRHLFESRTLSAMNKTLLKSIKDFLNITDEELGRLVQSAKKEKLGILIYLKYQNRLSSSQIVTLASQAYQLPIAPVESSDLSFENYAFIKALYHHRLLPINANETRVFFLASDPSDNRIIETLKTQYRALPVIKLVDDDSLEGRLYSLLKTHQIKKLNQPNNNPDNLLKDFLDDLILHASLSNISDIHIESHSEALKIRLRKDGVLFLSSRLPLHFSNPIISRLKSLAKLDITEKRLPQDGSFQMRIRSKLVEIRISTCPTSPNEKAVLRIIHSTTTPLDIHQLGMMEEQEELFKAAINKPSGMVLVTGPTGSGKSFTLYSALQFLKNETRNIISIEDPIEIKINGINQVAVNPKISLSFSRLLRSILRQDPDIIMIGEIRDKETAEIAIHAAQTGHLVFATLHTNNTIETISRLKNLSISSFNIASTIKMIISQRLVRKTCDLCNANGCIDCQNGYKNRTGIFEILKINSILKEMIHNNAYSESIHLEAIKHGFISLDEASKRYIENNITNKQEIERVL